jgi:pantoate kinase
MKGLLKVRMLRAQKEKKRAAEKSSIFLEDTKVITNRLVEIRTVQVIQMRSQMEMGKHVIKNWRKADPC